MVTIIVGKTASGKDSICKKLIALYNYKRIVTYTSRPKRKSEKDGIAYHFIEKVDFLDKIKENFFAEWKSYETVDGTWYYGTSLSELENAEGNTLLIMTPQGYRDICKKLKTKPKCIYIYANNKTIQERLILRGDDKEEAERRLKHDNEDFKDFEYESDKIFYNNSYTDLDELVERIHQFIK